MEARFLSKVDKDGANGCWNWTASCATNGYGHFNIDGKMIRAHRVAYELYVGEIPDGLLVRHKCKQNRKCVNPEHLETGTHQENMNDRIRDDTTANGIKHGRAKLNDDSVREIRRLYALGNITYKQLGIQFGVHQTTLSDIIRNKYWTHITPEAHNQSQ